MGGVNFASQDYLSLSSHPKVVGAVVEAANRYGVHSAGSPSAMGVHDSSLQLEQELEVFLQVADVTLFSTGWGAGYGIVKALVRETDHVIIDVLAHACLQEGARNATRNVHQAPHLSIEAVVRRLKRIRSADPDAGILVVTETLFSMDSDTPDLKALQDLCWEYEATLLVDVAHDLGSSGPTGLGLQEIQGLVGKFDVLIGSFSKTFASNGGFVASNCIDLKLMLRYSCGPLLFSNAISPINTAAIRASLEVIKSPEGAVRRDRLLQNSIRLRDGLLAEGFRVLGEPSAIVPVLIGDNAQAREMTRALFELGGVVNLVEHPVVSKNSCRWRMQVMADHTDQHIETMVTLAAKAREQVGLKVAV